MRDRAAARSGGTAAGLRRELGNELGRFVYKFRGKASDNPFVRDQMERIALDTLGQGFRDLIFSWKQSGIVFQNKGVPF